MADLMGVNSFDGSTTIPLSNMQFIKSKGANAVEQQITYEQWQNDSAYRSRWQTWANNAHAAGLKVVLSCYGRNSSPSEGWVQMKYNAVYNSSLRTLWINGFRDIIIALQADVVAIMNEPEPPIAPVDLKNFYLSCIDAWLAVKPNLSFIIQGVPWWNIATILTSPRVDQSRPNIPIHYATHYYYSYEGYEPQPDWGQEMVDYWNGNLAQAKINLYNAYLNSFGVQAAMNAGVKIMFEEFGGHILNPNVLQFMQDTFDFAKARNISVLWIGWWVARPVVGDFGGTGLISNWTPTLNSMGQVWAANMPTVEPPPPPPPTQYKLTVTAKDKDTGAPLNIPFDIVKM